MRQVVRIASGDNVAVALREIQTGEPLELEGISLRAAEPIAQGHKIALSAIPAGSSIIKYGVPIGHATEDIRPGAWVHTHNAATNLSGTVEYAYRPDFRPLEPIEPVVFQGFRRGDGRAAIRNEIWVLPTVGCVNDVCKALCQENQHLVSGSVEGLYHFPHPFGCSQMGEDHARTRKLLAALARHPNAGGVLVVSLGCENLTHEQFLEELGPYDPQRVKFLNCQEEEDELAAGGILLEELAAYAGTFQRESIPASELVVGLKCGGSDGLSGITANPAVGRFSDMLVAQGGSTLLTEVPEMFGAETVLLNRCRSEEIFRKASDMLNGFKNFFLKNGQPVYENPSPGNKEGGITTLEDKSCGCVQKGGTAPVMDVLDYGEPLRERGLNLLYGPGNDLVSSTALAASGAHMVLFTTGRGTPFGAPVPTVKIASNHHLAARKARWIDLDMGSVVDGESLEDAGTRILDYVLAVAGGQQTCSEQMGFREISILKDGVVL